jgi:ferredoxin
MTYVITAPCIDVKDGACTVACPVDSIYEGGRMFYIHPEECINCGLCLSICPVDAIVWDEEITDDNRLFLDVNREFFDSSVTGIGSPGGWDRSRSVAKDHPSIADFPKNMTASHS